jgi:hypothetical protein
MNTLGDYLLTKSWSNMIFEFFSDDSFIKNINKKYRKISLDFRNYEDLKIFLLKTLGDFGSLNNVNKFILNIKNFYKKCK